MKSQKLHLWELPDQLSEEELKLYSAELEQKASECGKFLRWWQDFKKRISPPEENSSSSSTFQLSS